MSDKRRRPELLIEQSAIVVIRAQAAFARDNFPLRCNFLGVELQILNAVCLDVENQRQGRTRKPVLVDGCVLRGVGVVFATVRFHDLVEFARAVFLRAIEHHVLEKVRNAGRAGMLIARTNSVKDVKRHVGDTVVALHQDFHSVL